MPPLETSLRVAAANFSTSTTQQMQQWAEPSDVFSVLLLLGGEIVSRALAQLAGGILTPVTFSFGWVSYAVSMLLASVGEAKLMPRAIGDQCLVITAKSGYTRMNVNWVVSRIFRDYEAWMHPAVRERLEAMLDERESYMRRNVRAGTAIERPGQTGLCIAIYEPSRSATAGEPKHDLIYWSGAVVSLVQFVIAAVPFATHGEWIVFMITVSGTVLALITGGLPQWRAEKWACRRNSHSTYILTQGNGSQHALIILGNGRGLNLEDLAIDGQKKYVSSSRVTRFSLAATALLWIVLLIVAAGVSTSTWYLLGVGLTGILQNVLVAGWRRDPSALGVHLDFRAVIGEMTTMDSLLALEAEMTGLGRCLLPIFFPGELLPEEMAAWEALSQKAAAEEERQRREKHERSRADHPQEGWVAHAKNFEGRRDDAGGRRRRSGRFSNPRLIRLLPFGQLHLPKRPRLLRRSRSYGITTHSNTPPPGKAPVSSVQRVQRSYAVGGSDKPVEGEMGNQDILLSTCNAPRVETKLSGQGV